MAEQDQNPTEANEISAEVADQDLDKVVGGTVNLFLKIDGVDGESADSKHKGEIHITS